MRKPYKPKDYLPAEKYNKLKKIDKLISVPVEFRSLSDFYNFKATHPKFFEDLEYYDELLNEADENYIASFNGDTKKLLNDFYRFEKSLKESDYDTLRHFRNRIDDLELDALEKKYTNISEKEKALQILSYKFADVAYIFSLYTTHLLDTDLEDAYAEELFKLTCKLFGNDYGFTYEDIQYKRCIRYAIEELDKVTFNPKKGKGTTAITPKNSILILEKASNRVFDNFPLGEAQDIAMEREGSKKEVNTIVKLDFDAIDNDANITITKELTHYDKIIYESISSLWAAGNQFMTTNMIYRAMVGDTKYSSEPSKKTRDEINASITKMSIAHIFIDNIQEHKAYKYGKFRYDASLLPMERLTQTINGNDAECIHLILAPPLYSYASSKKQIATIDMKLLQCPAGVNLTKQNAIIRSLLLTRIEHFKNKNCKLLHKDVILFDTIYSRAGIEKGNSQEKTQRQRVRESVKAFLDNFKSQKYINDYEIILNRQAPYSILLK